MQKKCLSDLTIKNNFMFGAVMINPENCRGLLERVLDMEIDHVEVSREKSMVYHPEYKGVRLDVYTRDENNTCYNVEMQVVKKAGAWKTQPLLSKPDGYGVALAGQSYEELPDTYVIFICDFDPFGEKKYRYTFQAECKESETAKLKDGRTLVFLSTCGENEKEYSENWQRF